MKRFDVDLVEKKAVEICSKARERNDLPTLHVAAIVSEIISAGIVDEAEKVECAHDWQFFGVPNSNWENVSVRDRDSMLCVRVYYKCRKCGVERDHVSDPIIEVWEMVNSRNDMEGLTVYAEDMWQAIKQYAKGKGKV